MINISSKLSKGFDVSANVGILIDISNKMYENVAHLRTFCYFIPSLL